MSIERVGRMRKQDRTERTFNCITKLALCTEDDDDGRAIRFYFLSTEFFTKVMYVAQLLLSLTCLSRKQILFSAGNTKTSVVEQTGGTKCKLFCSDLCVTE